MIGTIAGDIIGSVYERHPVRDKQFPLFSARSTFTDDTILSVAVAECLLTGGDYVTLFREYYRRYPNAGYGSKFRDWATSPDKGPYNSCGNGSAMRVSPIGWVFDSLEETLQEAQRSAVVTHNHPEGVKGAQATAAVIFLARTGADKDTIRSTVTERFQYDLDRSVEQIRAHYHFDVSCQGSVPEAIVAFLEGTDFEDCIRNAVFLGGDSDTQAAITGGMAEAFYKGVPASIEQESLKRLDVPLAEMTQKFRHRFF